MFRVFIYVYRLSLQLILTVSRSTKNFLLVLVSFSSWFIALRVSASLRLHDLADNTGIQSFALPMFIQYQYSYLIFLQSLQNVLLWLPFNCCTRPWTLKCKEMSLWHATYKIGEGQDDQINQWNMEQVSLMGGCDDSGLLDNLHPSKCPQCPEATHWSTTLHQKICVFPCSFPFSFHNMYTEAPLQSWFAWFRTG